MHLTDHCVTSAFDAAQQLWAFFKSDEGQVLVALIIASRTFAHAIRNAQTPEFAEFAAALLAATLMLMIIVITESKALKTIAEHVRQQCTQSEQLISLMRYPSH